MNIFLEKNNIILSINTDVEHVCGRPSLWPERMLDSLEIWQNIFVCGPLYSSVFLICLQTASPTEHFLPSLQNVTFIILYW